MSAGERENRLKIFEADFGRDFGWWVEREGRRRATLTAPRFEDMFWYSYAVEAVGEDATKREEVFSREFWEQPGLTFRNRETEEIAENAFPGGNHPTREQPRVWMRALYSSLEPTRWERVLLWWRRRRR